ncbi:GNAT domain-containing protein [Annulohypoxylon maeteangense]|uniref:GNAT domain-containing protein n=1 Tax=Annulohypoxylon maeteangense TaxID=1927788 RepID=UPI0020088685|nr:GNAT domain-containing protein [Annulohypoxylon maeteangense]KAI0883197.1 GNAT domain-containing protein [Annulohypoxylon maeteangense]
MRVNQDVAVCGNSIILVPYDKHHVLKYHEWMEDEKIRQLTASDRLSLEQEYENQASWRTSGDKLTFIICKGASFSNLAASASPVIAGKVDVPGSMAGDVNAFISPWDPADYEDRVTICEEYETKAYCAAEIDIMIADPTSRGKGLGRAAVAAFLLYIRRNLDEILGEFDGWSRDNKGKHKTRVLKEVAAKIYEDNTASIALFKSLGFKQRGGVNYFGEIELVLEGFGEEGFELKGTVGGDLVGMGYKEVGYDRSMLEEEV